MIFVLKTLIVFFALDYIILQFCRIADRIRLIEVYKKRNIYATHTSTSFGHQVIYTIDVPYAFHPPNDFRMTRVYSLQEARYKIDREIDTNIRSKFLEPLKKMKIL
jgi:hypothetical protein